VLILAKGRLVHTGPLASLSVTPTTRVLIDSPDRPALRAALGAAGLEPEETADGLAVTGSEPGPVGHVAFAAGVEVSLLMKQKPASGLEDAFLALVGEEGAL
jgi:ABC-2 type transport system ATP-binding protein